MKLPATIWDQLEYLLKNNIFTYIYRIMNTYIYIGLLQYKHIYVCLQAHGIYDFTTLCI